MSPSDISRSEPPRFPAWHGEYEAVLSETDHKALFKRVEIAEAAILTRRDTLDASSGHHPERQAIEEALERLRTIKKHRLKFL